MRLSILLFIGLSLWAQRVPGPGGEVPSGGSHSYTTSFQTVENPLSEGGVWYTGLAQGIQWSPFEVVTAGLTYGIKEANNGALYNDPTAVLNGVGWTWGPSQIAVAVAYVNGNTDTQAELNFHLNTTLNSGTTATATFTNGSASIAATNAFTINQVVQFITTNTLPTNFATGTKYYVISTGLSTSHFEVSATSGGGAITAGSAGSGTQSVTTSTNAGYGMGCSIAGNSSTYCGIARWNGPLGDYTPIGTNSGYNTQNGDILVASNNSGSLALTLYNPTNPNGTNLASATDTTYTGGAPGLGADGVNVGVESAYGWTYFYGTDNSTAPILVQVQQVGAYPGSTSGIWHQEAATCGTGAGTTCLISISTTAGDILVIQSATANAVKISSVNQGGTLALCPASECYQFNAGIGGIDSAYILSATSVASITVTMSAAHGDAGILVSEYRCHNGTASFDVAGSTQAAISGSTFTGQTLALTGTYDVISQMEEPDTTAMSAISMPYLHLTTSPGGTSFANVVGTSSGAAPTWSGATNTAAVRSGVALVCK